MFVWLVGFFTSSSITGLYRERVPTLTSDNFTCCHTQVSGETMTSVLAGHIILTQTQPVGSGRPQRGSNLGPPDQESRALPTELPRPMDGSVVTSNAHNYFNGCKNVCVIPAPHPRTKTKTKLKRNKFNKSRGKKCRALF